MKNKNKWMPMKRKTLLNLAKKKKSLVSFRKMNKTTKKRQRKLLKNNQKKWIKLKTMPLLSHNLSSCSNLQTSCLHS